MPAAKPPEFRSRAVDLACGGQHPVTEVTTDLGSSESCLRRSLHNITPTCLSVLVAGTIATIEVAQLVTQRAGGRTSDE